MPGAPPDTLVTSAGGLTIHTLPTSNSAGTSDTVALPVQGVTGGVPMPVSNSSVLADGGIVAIGSTTDGTWSGTGNSTVTQTLRALYSVWASTSVLTGVGTGTTGAVTATLAAVAGKTTYITGVDISAIGGTAPISPVTITGLMGGNTFTYQGIVSSATGTGIIPVRFPRDLPGSAVNTAIVVTTTAAAGATAVALNVFGYSQ